jgi:hypothetical protein
MTANTKATAKDRPVYIAKFRALPDVDPICSLRQMLKQALRVNGLQCLSLVEEEHATQTTPSSSDA